MQQVATTLTSPIRSFFFSFFFSFFCCPSSLLWFLHFFCWTVNIAMWFLFLLLYVTSLGNVETNTPIFFNKRSVKWFSFYFFFSFEPPLCDVLIASHQLNLLGFFFFFFFFSSVVLLHYSDFFSFLLNNEHCYAVSLSLFCILFEIS